MSTARKRRSSVGPIRFGRVVAVCLTVAVLAPAVSAQPSDTKPAVQFDKDRKFLYRVRDFGPLKIGSEDKLEHEAFCELVLHARSFPAADLLAAARKDVNYHDLMNKDDRLREDVRFELIRFDGKLKRLKRIGTIPNLKEAGIAELYEAWVFTQENERPVCVLLTDPPTGVEPADDISPGRSVTVGGYFLKLVEYQSNEPNPKRKDQTLIRRAPVLVGRTLYEPENPTGSGDTVLTQLVPVVLVGGGAVVVLILALAVWLRRTDRGVRAYVAHRARNPFDDTQPPADASVGDDR